MSLRDAYHAGYSDGYNAYPHDDSEYGGDIDYEELYEAGYREGYFAREEEEFEDE